MVTRARKILSVILYYADFKHAAEKCWKANQNSHNQSTDLVKGNILLMDQALF